MPSLSDQQSGFVQAILTGAAPDMAIRKGPVSAAAALQIHRNTVIGALVHALRLVYPTVLAVVGEDFFESAAAAFARAHPPTTMRLTGYGAAFADFLSARAPSLPYLRDVARLDWALECAQATPDTVRRFALDGGVALAWPVSLTLLALEYPAGEIKSALGDDAALAAIDMARRERRLLVWRSGHNVFTRDIGAASAAFVAALLGDGSAEAALTPDALASIQNEILTASFCTVTTGDPT